MDNMKRILLLSLMALSLSACYWNDDVGASQQGLLINSNQVRGCVGPGIYNDGDFFADLWEISTETLTFEVTDPSVATRDTQIVGVTLQIQARRSSDCESLTTLFTQYPALIDNNNLQTTIGASASEAIKVAVRSMTLDELLNDRVGLSTSITKSLSEDTTKYGSEIANVSIKDIQLDPAYEAKLKEKAEITVNIEIAERKQDQIAAEAAAERIKQEEAALTYAAQLEAEQAKTQVEVEIAAREGEKTAAAYQVYVDNPAAYRLEQLKLLEKVLGDKSSVYFVQNVEDLMLLLTGEGNPTPPVIPVEESGGSQ
jgi:regulator of protease activity HflC (stomatin/prohibitin superfamily)